MRNWNELVRRERVVELGPPSSSDIAQRIRHANEAIEDSRIAGLRPSRRFQMLYEAAYRWSDLVLRVEGWRTKGEGHHETLFSALPHFLGDDVVGTARYLDRCRKRRNIVLYGSDFPPVTDLQVEELANNVQALKPLILKWLRENHPEIATT